MSIDGHRLSPLALNVAAALEALDVDRAKAWQAYEREDAAHKATKERLEAEVKLLERKLAEVRAALVECHELRRNAVSTVQSERTRAEVAETQLAEGRWWWSNPKVVRAAAELLAVARGEFSTERLAHAAVAYRAEFRGVSKEYDRDFATIEERNPPRKPQGETT